MWISGQRDDRHLNPWDIRLGLLNLLETPLFQAQWSPEEILGPATVSMTGGPQWLDLLILAMGLFSAHKASLSKNMDPWFLIFIL